MPQGSYLIRERREELGWSQLKLAVQAGVSQRTVQFAEAGEATLTSSKITQIAQALDLTFGEVSQAERAEERDRFTEWPWSASKWIQQKLEPEPEAYCRDESDVQEVLAEMRKNWRRHLDRSGVGDHEEGEVYCDADDQLNQSYFRYEQRYLSLWRRCPSVIQLATHNGLRTGASIVLPVTDSAYERLRDGEISFMDIGADDLCEESQNLILDHAVEFSDKPRQSWYRLTDRLSFALFSQMAAHAHDPSADDFRMLSFAASPINIRRLEGMGFRQYGVRMPEFQYSLCEFSIDPFEENDSLYSTRSTWAHFTHLAKRLSSPVSKQRVVRTVLKALQRAIKSDHNVSKISSAA